MGSPAFSAAACRSAILTSLQPDTASNSANAGPSAILLQGIRLPFDDDLPADLASLEVKRGRPARSCLAATIGQSVRRKVSSLAALSLLIRTQSMSCFSS